MKKLLFLCLFLSSFAVSAEQMFPKPGWVEKMNPLASPDAVPGGEISIYAGPYPSSLNYLLDNNSFSAEIFGGMYETLLGNDPITLESVPGIANKWSISDDKKTFTFWINPKARWSDGKPITAEDVKWTFDTIMDPKNLTGPFKVGLGRFDSVQVLAPDQVRFHAKMVHWVNLDTAGGMVVLPKHAYGGKDFNLLNFEFPVISGPYKLKEIKEGIYISMERRADWWNRNAISNKGIGNFQILKFKVYEVSENAFDAFQKGEIDLYPVHTSAIWVNKTTGEKYDNNWIVKQKVTNYNPIGFQGFAMNMRKPPFNDARVRKAMAMLLDREKMNSTLMYNQYFLHKSYFEDLYGKDHPCPNQLVKFDKAGARELLKEAGWTVKSTKEKGILQKNGVPFAFTFLNRDESTNKFLAIYAEDLKDVGISMKIELKDQASWTKDMDNYNYQMSWASWGSGQRKDPEDMWYSKEASRPSGSNITGFQDPKVDALIEQQREIFDIPKTGGGRAPNRSADLPTTSVCAALEYQLHTPSILE